MLEKVPAEERGPRQRPLFWRSFAIAAVIAVIVFAGYLLFTAPMPQESENQAPVAVPQADTPGANPAPGQTGSGPPRPPQTRQGQ